MKHKQDKWQNYGLYSRFAQHCLGQHENEFRELPIKRNKYRISVWRAVFIYYFFRSYGCPRFFSSCAEQTWNSRNKGGHFLNRDYELKQSLSELSHELILTNGLFFFLKKKESWPVSNIYIYISTNLVVNLTCCFSFKAPLFFKRI